MITIYDLVKNAKPSRIDLQNSVVFVSVDKRLEVEKNLRIIGNYAVFEEGCCRNKKRVSVAFQLKANRDLSIEFLCCDVYAIVEYFSTNCIKFEVVLSEDLKIVSLDEVDCYLQNIDFFLENEVDVFRFARESKKKYKV